MNYSVKYGVIQNLDREVPITDSVDRATLALRRIKGRFNTHVAIYDEEMRRIQIQEHQLVELAEPAIENREFQIYYQPKHSLRRRGGACPLDSPAIGLYLPRHVYPAL